MSEIIPAILPTDVADLEYKIAELPKQINYFHLDEVGNDAWIPTHLNFEVHLMIPNPKEVALKWVERGAKRIIVHETSDEIMKFRDKVEIGLAVELKIPISNILPLVSQVDFIHLMSIDNLGTQGDNFEPVIFDRIKELRDKYPEVTISVDGGVKIDNYKSLEDASINRLIVGSGFKDLWESLMKE